MATHFADSDGPARHLARGHCVPGHGAGRASGGSVIPGSYSDVTLKCDATALFSVLRTRRGHALSAMTGSYGNEKQQSLASHYSHAQPRLRRGRKQSCEVPGPPVLSAKVGGHVSAMYRPCISPLRCAPHPRLFAARPTRRRSFPTRRWWGPGSAPVAGGVPRVGTVLACANNSDDNHPFGPNACRCSTSRTDGSCCGGRRLARGGDCHRWFLGASLLVMG